MHTMERGYTIGEQNSRDCRKVSQSVSELTNSEICSRFPLAIKFAAIDVQNRFVCRRLKWSQNRQGAIRVANRATGENRRKTCDQYKRGNLLTDAKRRVSREQRETCNRCKARENFQPTPNTWPTCMRRFYFDGLQKKYTQHKMKQLETNSLMTENYLSHCTSCPCNSLRFPTAPSVTSETFSHSPNSFFLSNACLCSSA